MPPFTREELAKALGLDEQFLPVQVASPAPIGGSDLADPKLLASNFENYGPSPSLNPKYTPVENKFDTSPTRSFQFGPDTGSAVESFPQSTMTDRQQIDEGMARGQNAFTYGGDTPEAAKTIAEARAGANPTPIAPVEGKKPEKVDAVFATSDGDVSRTPSFNIDALIPSGGGPSILPGHEVRKVSPETERLLGKADTAEQAALESKARADELFAKAQAENARQIEKIHADLAAQQRDQEARRQAVLDQHFEDQAKLSDSIRNFKIDPDAVWGEGIFGAFNKIAGIVGRALGSYAATRSGGPNFAAQVIDSMTDREIDAQKAELAKRKGMLEDSRSLLAQKMQQFGDERIAAAAAKTDVLEAAKAAADARTAIASNSITQANNQLLQAALDEKIAKHRDQVLAWQGPQMTGGDPRTKRYAEMLDKLVMAKVPVDQAKAMAFQTVFGVDVGAGEMSVPSAKGGIGRGSAALVGRLAALKTIRSDLEKEIAVVKKGTSATQEEWNQSETRHEILPAAMASAIDNSASDAKVKAYKDALGGSVGIGGAIMQTGRVARLQQALETVNNAEKNIRAELAGTGAEDEETESTLDTAKPIE